MRDEYFDVSLIKKFRALINSSNVFSDLPEYRHYWNLMCVLLDRLDSAVHYLNLHIERPKTEEDLIFFFVYASILRDGIYKFYENIYGIKPKTIDYKKWFIDAHNYSKPLFDDTNCPTDDVFFEYLRSLSFAHPFGTSKRSERVFMENREVHYSPWVIAHSIFDFKDDSVGLRVYSSNNDGLTDIFISFNNLKEYLLERYLLLNDFIAWGNDAIFKQNEKWMKVKIDRSGSPIETLKNACIILEERFLDHYTLDYALVILNATFKYKQNNIALRRVKDRIIENINNLCDCIDNLDYEGMEECLKFLFERPKKMHPHAYYELEKIFNYLEDTKGPCLRGSNEEWGLIQAKQFYESYAKQFVKIDFNKMNYLDIKILISISLILGKENEDLK